MIVPMMQNFGLIYRERFKDLGISSTNVTFIISVNSGLGMLLGKVLQDFQPCSHVWSNFPDEKSEMKQVVLMFIGGTRVLRKF